MKIKIICLFILLTLSPIVLNSCSLKYEQKSMAEEVNPEFLFSNTVYNSYSNGQLTATITAEKMERYKKSNDVYAKNVEFATYNSENAIENDGSCGYMHANPETEFFEFFDGIHLFSNSFGASFSANVLRWNGKNQQLTGGRTDYVFIEKDNTTLHGSGFSASGISGTYLFRNTAEGSVETNSVQEIQNQPN